MKNCRAYTSFESVKSDHRIVFYRCQIGYRQSKAPSPDPMRKIEWKKVIADVSLCEEYAVAVPQQFLLPLLTNLKKSQTSVRSTISYPQQTKKSLWRKYRKGEKHPILSLTEERSKLQDASSKKSSEAHYICPTGVT